MAITAKIIHKEEKKNNGMLSRSSSVRMYQQAVSIPTDADEGSIKTEYKNGKLIIYIDKNKGFLIPNSIKINGKIQQTNKQKVDKIPENSHLKESKSTIKKEVIHSDKNSII
jgi:hypothetical protein